MARDKSRHQAWETANKARRAEQRSQNKAKNFHRYWARTSIYNHIKRDMVVEFDVSWLEEKALNTECCELCGEKLRWEPAGFQGMYFNTPTLDRVFNATTLTKDTIKILCNSCNSGKGTQSLEEYIAKCKRIAQKYESEMI